MRADQRVVSSHNLSFHKLRTLLSNQSRSVLTAALALITIATLALLIVRDWDIIWQFEWHFSPSLLALALCAHAVSLVGTFIAWKLIMRYLGSEVKASTDFQFYFLALAARKLPSVIWYAGARAFLYAQEKISAFLVLSAIAIEFVIGIVTGGWVFVAFHTRYIFLEDYAWIGKGLGILTLVITIFILIRPHWTVSWIQRRKAAHESNIIIRPTRRMLVICSLVYVAAWVVGGTSFYLTIWALVPSPEIDWFNAVGIATLSTLIVLLGAIVPLGIGLKELAAGVLLSKWLPLTVGLSVSVIYRLLQTLDEALWIALAYLLYISSQARAKKERAASAPDNPNEVLH